MNLTVFAQSSSETVDNSKFASVDEIAIIRGIYPTEALTTDLDEVTKSKKFQIGELETHVAKVMYRIEGKFTQSENREMIAFVGVENPNSKSTTGIYGLLFGLDQQAVPRLMAKSSKLQLKIEPFANKFWKPVVATDVDFDKCEEIIMLEGNTTSGAEKYTIFKWLGKDFQQLEDLPLQTLLNFYAKLDAAARLGTNDIGDTKLGEALDQLSEKMKSVQSMEGLRNRLKKAKSVEIDALKVMIRSSAGVLIRVEYHLVEPQESGPSRLQGDYQVKLFGSGWQVDSERLKVND
ncbi:MAG: hypothetical protein JNN15_08105 [Blastocatellia bacterium]|nr:hypothetical protein [Blastocatellia bacterium]